MFIECDKVRFTLSDYAKIAIYAIKNKKISEFVDLKIQKDRDKKKTNVKPSMLKTKLIQKKP